MKIHVRTNSEVGTTPFMKEAVVKKMERMKRVIPQDSVIDCFCKTSNKEKVVTAQLHSPRYNIQAEGRDNNFYKALDKVYERLDKQVRRLHNEQVTKHGEGIAAFENKKASHHDNESEETVVTYAETFA